MGLSLTGWPTFNEDLHEHGEPTVGYGSYLTTGHFVEATFENWESEFLQMARSSSSPLAGPGGSAESKHSTGDPQGRGPADAAR